MKLIVGVLVITFFSLSTYGQSDDFKRLFSEATLDLYNENYESALKKLQELNKMDAQNSNILFQIGYCHLQPPVNTKKAIDCLQKASSNVSKTYKTDDYKENKAPIEVFKHLGDAYHLNYQFETAIATYERFCAN
jgi:tetratricopeptide (TPR) repeat protein